MDRKGEYQDFPSNFCLTVPKISVVESFSVHYFREPKKFGQKRGDYQDFPLKFFVSQCRKFLGERFTVAIVSCIEKVWIKGGGSIMIFRRNFLTHSAGILRR